MAVKLTFCELNRTLIYIVISLFFKREDQLYKVFGSFSKTSIKKKMPLRKVLDVTLVKTPSTVKV